MARPPRASSPSGRFRRLRRERVLGVVVPVADRPATRLFGLAHLPRERAGPGLLLPRCSAVHTLGMRFELDLFFLDEAGLPLRIERAVGPRRFLAERRASAVLELPTADPSGASWCGPGFLEASTREPAGTNTRRGGRDAARDRDPGNGRRL